MTQEEHPIHYSASHFSIKIGIKYDLYKIVEQKPIKPFDFFLRYFPAPVRSLDINQGFPNSAGLCWPYSKNACEEP